MFSSRKKTRLFWPSDAWLYVVAVLRSVLNQSKVQTLLISFHEAIRSIGIPVSVASKGGKTTHLYPQHEVTVGVFHLPLPALQLLGPLLLPLQPPDVVHRGLQNGALIPAHVSGGG